MIKLSIEKLMNFRKVDFENPLYYYASILNYSKLTEDNYVDAKKAEEKMLRDGADPVIVSKLLLHFLYNKWSSNIFKSEYLYRKGGYKNYVPSRPLLEVLSKVKVDMPAKNIPMDYKAYFELGGYMGAGYALVDMAMDGEDTVVRISVSDNGMVTEGYYMGVKTVGDENILEAMERMGFYDYDVSQMKHVETTVPEHIRAKVQLVINLIVYTTSPNQDFIEQFNKFSPNNRLAQKEKLEYTSKPYVLIGHDAEFLRLVTVEKGSVAPHPRWQPCGPERKQRKLIMVRGHERNYKKFKGETYEQTVN